MLQILVPGRIVLALRGMTKQVKRARMSMEEAQRLVAAAQARLDTAMQQLEFVMQRDAAAAAAADQPA